MKSSAFATMSASHWRSLDVKPALRAFFAVLVHLIAAVHHTSMCCLCILVDDGNFVYTLGFYLVCLSLLMRCHVEGYIILGRTKISCDASGRNIGHCLSYWFWAFWIGVMVIISRAVLFGMAPLDLAIAPLWYLGSGRFWFLILDEFHLTTEEVEFFRNQNPLGKFFHSFLGLFATLRWRTLAVCCGGSRGFGTPGGGGSNSNPSSGGGSGLVVTTGAATGGSSSSSTNVATANGGAPGGSGGGGSSSGGGGSVSSSSGSGGGPSKKKVIPPMRVERIPKQDLLFLAWLETVTQNIATMMMGCAILFGSSVTTPSEELILVATVGVVACVPSTVLESTVYMAHWEVEQEHEQHLDHHEMSTIADWGKMARGFQHHLFAGV